VVCFFNDITKRKRAELAQRRLAVLTAANKQANREIARRRLVEAFLRESEQSQTRLLAESRELHGQLRHLTRQIITAQEEERKKISRELHDDVMQTLVGINSALANLAGEESSVAPSALGLKIARTQRLVKESLLAVRQFARDLRPSVLDDFGLVAALQAYTEGLAAKEKFRVTLTTSGDLEPLDNIRRTVLFRVAQEALTNVARHAHASAVALRVTAIPGTVRMEVRDNGRSFPVQATLAPGKNQRLGLLGMRERVEMIGGTLLIKSAPGRGTLLCAEIPFNSPDATG
jgi:signal transduction histidine kinase